MRPRTAAARADSVIESGWKASPELPVIEIGSPIQWGTTDPMHRSWVFRLHCLDMVESLLVAHSETADVRYLMPALSIGLEWVREHPARESPDPSGFAWYDMAVGLRLQRLAYIHDAAERQGLLNAADAGPLLASLQQHAEYMADEANITFHNNHGFYQIAGHLALIRRFEKRLPDLTAAKEQALARFNKMLELQFSREGIHREHSPEYHRMVYESLGGLLRAGLVQDRDAITRATLIEDALAWFVLPNGYLVNFGDSDAICMRSPRGEVVDRWRGDSMRFIASGGAIGALPPESSRSFPESGYWVVRQTEENEEATGSYLGLAAAFHSRTHKHADDLNIVWYDRGQEILVDAGRYGYLGKTEPGSPKWQEGFWYDDPRRIYVESTRAHNTVEIDGRSFNRKIVEPYGSALLRNGAARSGVYFCEAETKHFRSIRHARVVLYSVGEWLVVFDWLHDNVDSVHTYRQWFHLSPAMSLSVTPKGLVAGPTMAGVPLRIASLLPENRLIDPVIASESDGMQGYYSPREQLLIPNYAFGYMTEPARTANIATLFSFSHEIEVDHGWSKATASGRSARFRWLADGARHSITMTRPETGALDISYDVK